MKCLSHAVLSAGLLALTLASSSNAQVPQHLNHQGILTDDAGVIVPDGTYVLQFQIYDTPSASTTPLFEQQLTANVVNGLYNVLLSDNQGGALGDAFTGATRYLQLKIITSPGGTYDNLVLSPRQQIASVPYALVAGRVSNEAELPQAGSITCRDTDTSTTPDRYTSSAWADAQVSCSVTVPGDGHVILVNAVLFADNDNSNSNSLLARIRENCGGATGTVAFGMAYVSNDQGTEEVDLAYVPLSYTRLITQQDQSCTYSLEGRAARSGGSPFDMNIGDGNDTDDPPNPEEIVTSIEVLVLPTH
jgi:hypothetical protein